MRGSIARRRRSSSRGPKRSTAFRFSLHVGDVGHTLIVGPTGAGKSVLLALMALRLLDAESERLGEADV
jgi:type IV secretory pathway VirB4 component